MLPTLTVRGTHVPPRRWMLAVASLLLLTAAWLAHFDTASATPTRVALADRLPAASWAFAVPLSWFAAPLADLRSGDRVDVLAIRPGERTKADAIALDLEVMTVDERTVVLSVGANDAMQLTAARASAQLLVPLLRSSR